MTDKEYNYLIDNPFNEKVDSYCSCENQQYVLAMMVSYSPNPVRCINCLDLIDPSSLNIPGHLLKALAVWSISHSAIQWLGFHAERYESWSNAEACNINSGINTEGLELRQHITHEQPVLYWHSRDPEFNDISCPICNGTTQEVKHMYSSSLQCSKCNIALAPLHNVKNG